MEQFAILLCYNLGFKAPMIRKTHEDAVNEAKNLYKGKYTLLGAYQNSKALVDFECPDHGTFSRSWNVFQRGTGYCPKCMPGKGSSNSTKPFDQAFADVVTKHPLLSFPLFSEEYTSPSSKVTVVCHIHGVNDTKVRVATLQMGAAGCGKCNIEKGVAHRRTPLAEFITQSNKVHGSKFDYSLVEYTSTLQKVKIGCPIHGIFEQTAQTHMAGRGCQKCYTNSRIGQNTVSFDDYVARAKKAHSNLYTYTSEGYIGVVGPITVVCPTHGPYTQKAADHLHNGAGCPRCGVAQSKGEIEVKEYVESLGFVTQGSFKYAGRKEIDILVNSHNLAIEYDGLPWHSTKHRTQKEQAAKTLDMKTLGISLIRIFEDEWSDRPQQVKNLIANRLGVKQASVFARKTAIVELSDGLAQQFYEANHIQGWKRTGTNLSLQYEGRVIAVMTFTKSLSQRGLIAEEGMFELARYATSVSVPGGASRLFSNLCKKLDATKVVSYSDNRLFSGSMYGKLGFSLVTVSPPNYSYWYINSKKRQHKSKFKHENLPALLGSKYDPNLTEKANCENAGYYQIFDDGLTKWLWTRP